RPSPQRASHRPRRGGSRRGSLPDGRFAPAGEDATEHDGQLRGLGGGRRARRRAYRLGDVANTGRRAAGGRRSVVALHRRELAWDGCLNVRDLGGHPTDDGGETRYGAVVRADSVRQLSDAGWAALVEYGVDTIVDLRMDQELAADPPADLPV